MKIGLRSVLGAAVVLLALPAQAEPRGFEGKVQLRLQDMEPQGADYVIGRTHVAIDVPSVGHAHDLHMTVELAGLPGLAGDASSVVVRPTGRFRTVVGQLCEEWILVDGDRAVQACVARGIPWVDPRRVVAADVPAWSRRLELEKAFPLSVTDGAKPWWATEVTPEPGGVL